MATTSAPSSVSSTLGIIHQRRHITVVCLILCVVLALVSAMRLVPMNAMAAPLIGALLFVIHGLLDPSRQGFLHHRRLRFIGLFLTGASAVATGLIAPPGATPALIFAVAIAYRHHRGGTRLYLAAATEIEELRQKVLALECRHVLTQQLQAMQHPMDDKMRKAS